MKIEINDGVVACIITIAVCVVLTSLIFTVASYHKHKAELVVEMVKAGSDPIKAGCAISVSCPTTPAY